jgi:hypothetical protein
MKPDFYTKTVLTVIAIALIVIACERYVSPPIAQAQGPFASVQFSSNAGMFSTFDSRTGDVWVYYGNGKNSGPLPRGHVKLTAPGAPAILSEVK